MRWPRAASQSVSRAVRERTLGRTHRSLVEGLLQLRAMLFLRSLIPHQRVQSLIRIGGILTSSLERLDAPALVLNQDFALRDFSFGRGQQPS